MQIKKDISYCHCRIRHGSGRQRYKRQGAQLPIREQQLKLQNTI